MTVAQRHKKLIANNRGQAIMQVMMAVGLIALLAVGVSQVANNVNSTIKRQGFSRDVTSLTTMLRAMLSTRELSRQYLKTLPLDDTPIETGGADPRPAIAVGTDVELKIQIPFYPNGQDVFPAAGAAGELKDMRMRIDRLYFTVATVIPIDPVGATPRWRHYTGTIRLVASSLGNASTSASREIGRFTCAVQSSRTVPAPAPPSETRPIGTLVECYSEDSPREICQKMGCAYSDTTSPKCRCGLFSPPYCTPSSCTELGPDFYIAGIDSSGCPICRDGTFTCPQTPFPQTLIGIKYDSGYAEADCRPFYADVTTAPPVLPFEWRQGEFGACTPSVCGLGNTQTASQVYCQNTSTFEMVGDGACVGAGAKPAAATRPCAISCDCTQDLNWTVGAHNCVLQDYSLPNGATMTVVDGLGATTGQAAFTCTNGVVTGPLGAPAPTCATSTPPAVLDGTGCAACPAGSTAHMASPNTDPDPPDPDECWTGNGDQVDSSAACGLISVRVCNMGVDGDGDPYAGRFRYSAAPSGWYPYTNYLNDQLPGGPICQVGATDIHWQIRGCNNWGVGVQHYCLDPK